ncbi:MAG: cell division protein FtsQ/DivIB [Myxococcota bacterium]
MNRHHRFDRDSSARRARAHAHLARVRGRQASGGVRGAARALPVLRLGRAAPIVALLAGALGLWLGDGLIFGGSDASEPVRAIAVRGAERVALPDVAAATGIAGGAPLASVDAGAVARNLEAHDWIGRARALRLPGGTVVVDVDEREPVATVVLDAQRYAVDAEGEPFAPVDDDALPGLVELVAQGEVAPREPSPDLATAAGLARRLPELGLAAPRQVRIAADGDPLGFGLLLPAPGAEVVLGREDLDARLQALARLLATRPDVAADAASIDLRFADQVVLRSAPVQDGSAKNAAGRGGVRPRNLQPTG